MAAVYADMGCRAGYPNTAGHLLTASVLNCPEALMIAKILIPETEQSETAATYALCGFANFASLAIQVGGIGSLAPERRSEMAGIGFRAMIGGLLASYTTAAIAGMLL